jgi:F-type H+-transporting ATPase subunit epsilon
MTDVMDVALRLPTRMFHQGPAAKLVARAPNGSFGILPAHIDFVTALVPCVLILSEPEGREQVFGVDEGILVKHENRVDICVRRAVLGANLADLKAIVREKFIEIDEQERSARAAVSRLEADVVRRFAELKEASR